MPRLGQMLLVFTLLASGCQQILPYAEPKGADSTADLATLDGGPDTSAKEGGTLADSGPCLEGQVLIDESCRCTRASCPAGCCDEVTQECLSLGMACSPLDCAELTCSPSLKCELSMLADGQCWINGSCYLQGDTPSADDDCRFCDSTADQQHWSIRETPGCVRTLATLSSSPIDVDVTSGGLPIYVATADGQLLQLEYPDSPDSIPLSVGWTSLAGLALYYDYNTQDTMLAFSQENSLCIESLDVSNDPPTASALYSCGSAMLVGPQGLDAAAETLAIADVGQVRLVNLQNLAVVSLSPGVANPFTDVAFAPNANDVLLLNDQGELWLYTAMAKRVLLGTALGPLNGVAARALNNGAVEVFFSASDHRIYHLIYTGAGVTTDNAVVLFAGSGAEGSDDGPAAKASFSTPRGLAIGWSASQQQLLIADSGNNAIRGIYLDPP